MLGILLGLGRWQLERRAWKTTLLATIAERMNAAPVDLPLDIQDPEAWLFRTVQVAGRFADDHALDLYGRTFDGKAGVHLLVPLIRDEGGGAILVDRGFVPFAHGNTLADFTGGAGRLTLTGVVRAPEPGGWFLPAANPAQNIWYAVDIPAMSASTGLALAPVYLASRSTGAHSIEQGAWPAAVGGTEGTGIRNEHLNYAIFWFSMAAALIVIYVMSSLRSSSRTGQP